ncbi:hypothetical protein JCM8097_007731 [Rhodosporidiobolus ruineniae]
MGWFGFASPPSGTVEFRVTLRGDTRRFRVPRNPSLSWSALEDLIKSDFSLAPSDRVALRYKDESHSVITIDGEQNVQWLWVHVAFWNFLGHATIDGEVIPAPAFEEKKEESDTVDILVGSHPYYRRFTFAASPRPSLDSVLSLAKSHLAKLNLLPDPNPLLFLVGKDGRMVLIDGEEDWERCGWEAARTASEEGKKEGRWEAATFHLGALPPANLPFSPHLAYPSPPSEDYDGSTNPLFSPLPSAASVSDWLSVNGALCGNEGKTPEGE